MLRKRARGWFVVLGGWMRSPNWCDARRLIFFKSLLIVALAIVGCGKQDELIGVTSWGPQETAAGQLFNPQPDGSSAIWFKYYGIADPDSVVVWFGDVSLGHPVLSKDFGSFIVPSRLTKQPGEYDVFLVLEPSKERIDIGIFRVD